MRAAVHSRYGGPEVVEVVEMDEPRVADDSVVIRVVAASVNRSDWEALTGKPAYVRLSGAGFRRPKQPVLGTDVAGRVEAVGPGVTRFKPGDEVLGDVIYHGGGTFAELVAVPEGAPLAIKPPGVSWEQAAAIPQAGQLALLGSRSKGGVEGGQSVLINGAGGGGGTFAIQIAKAMGAEVTAVDSAAKLDLMDRLGADHVVDYTTTRYTRLGKRFDRIIDFVGKPSVFARRRALRRGGVYFAVGGTMPSLLATAAMGLTARRGHFGVLVARPGATLVAEVAEMVALGSITPAIDRAYALEETPDALGRMGAEQVLGKLVITP